VHRRKNGGPLPSFVRANPAGHSKPVRSPDNTDSSPAKLGVAFVWPVAEVASLAHHARHTAYRFGGSGGVDQLSQCVSRSPGHCVQHGLRY